MKIKTIAIFAAALLVAACDSTDSDGLQGQIDELKSEQIATVDQQIAGINASLSLLEAADKALKDYISALEGSAGELQAKDDSLEQKIAELRKFVNDELKNAKDWASATFATLEQYQGLVGEIAGIKADIASMQGAVETAYTKAIQDAISESEASMKTWVNSQLTGYYTIAEMNAKLDVLGRAITDGDAATLATLRGELATAKEDITTAYGKAIAEAISENNGTINQKISDEIKSATDALQGKIDALTERVAALEARMAALEADVARLIAMVQSVVVVPDYSDGSVALSKVADNEVRFEVYPLAAAEAIAQAGPSILSLDYVETMTRSSEQMVNLPVREVSFTGKTLLLTVDGTDLPGAVLEGESSACARLMISDGTNTRSSEYFPIYRKVPDAVVTGEYEDLGEISVTVYGYSALDGEAYGIEFDQSDLSYDPNAAMTEVKGADNKFNCRLTGLSSNTRYYYRAFVLCNGVRIYGKSKSFTTRDFSATLTTEVVTDIGVFAATLNGSLQVNSVDTLDKEVGFLLSDSASALDEMVSWGYEAMRSDLQQDGTFSYKLYAQYQGRYIGDPPSLKRNTTYYVVAWAKVHGKLFYGEVKSFTTQEDFTATVTTGEATDIGLFAATLNGSLEVSTPEPLYKSVGWKTLAIDNSTMDTLTPDGLMDWLKTGGNTVYAETLQTDGSFSHTYTNLQNNTTYYVVSFARVHDKEYYGEVISFTTQDYTVTVTTGAATDIGVLKATMNGSLNVSTNELDQYDKYVGFVYSDSATTLDELKTGGVYVYASLQSDGSFSYDQATSLKPGTIYYVAAWASILNKDYYGEVKTFTTQDLTVTTGAATSVDALVTTLYGSLEVSTAETLSMGVGFIFSDSASTLDELRLGDYISVLLQPDGTFSYDLTVLSSNSACYYVAYASVGGKKFYGEVKTFTPVSLPTNTNPVDLGLSVKWASFNLSKTGFVSALEKSGDYYAWGETGPYYNSLSPLSWKNGKTGGYDWSSYKWCNGSSTTLTKYNSDSSYGNVDNMTVLEAEDDAAHVVLGGAWRIPTFAEWNELIENCTWIWATLNGVSGELVISGKNGNRIFLPSYLYRTKTTLSGARGCNYWSSTRNSGRPDLARVLYATGNAVSASSRDRRYGLAIRPVSD